jgi:autotransporter-associated beta strand protein
MHIKFIAALLGSLLFAESFLLASPAETGTLASQGVRHQRVAELKQRDNLASERARAWAAARGEPMRFKANGRVLQLVDVTPEDGPIYLTTMNVNAGISTAANLLRAAPYNLDGTNILAGIWDGGDVRSSHQEFGGRVTLFDNSGVDDHATHVAGTMIAAGVNASALGMAPRARLDSYDFDTDLTEMTGRAMATPGESGTIQLSNHSYGYLTGWTYVFGTPRWYGTVSPGVQISDNFGRYSSLDVGYDDLLYDAPYYLPFKSAGNDRGEGRPANGTTFIFANTGQTAVYDETIHPYGDDWNNGGYDSIPFGSVAKNMMLIGAVNDAVSGGSRSTGAATMSTFSSWGPTDDGRIKPDIVANGVELTSPIAGSDTAYGISSGTSMSAPNASGSALLVLERYQELFPGEYMLASTIKALFIHTADDIGNPGPDYQNGWGLMNAKAAVDHLATHQANPEGRYLTEASISTTNTLVNYAVYWDNSSPIHATLVWTDPPGTAKSGLNNTNLALVNNLNLRVIGPNGTTNFPFILDPANPGNYATTGDNFRDNVEQVHIENPGVAGEYQVQITYNGSLTDNRQGFSLMISGISGSVSPAEDVRIEGDSSFGAVEAGATATRNFTLFNTSDVTLSITNVAYPAGFSGSWTGVLGAGATCDLPVSFAPSEAGSFSGNLTLHYAETTGTTALAISGSGVNGLVLTVTNPPGDIVVAEAVTTYDLQGTAGASLTGQFAWTNEATGAAGTIAATTNWQVSGISLDQGANAITISGTNQPAGSLWASDSAANNTYDGGWTSGGNGGSGFQEWILQGAPNAGFFRASGQGNLSSGDPSWGLYANNDDTASAYRPFSRPLQSGDTFRVTIDNNWIDTGKSVGVALWNPDSEYLFEFFFVGGGSAYTINDNTDNRNTGISYTDASLNLALTMTSSNTYSLLAGATTITGTFKSRANMNATRFRAWNFSSGSGDNYNFYFNQLSISSAPPAVVSTSVTTTITRTDPPAGAPASIWVSVTNTFNLTANWSAVDGASGYLLDVHTGGLFGEPVAGSETTEDFSALGASDSTYTTRIWTNNAIVWTGYQASVVSVDGSAMGLRNAGGAYFTSGAITGGITGLTLQYARAGGAPTSFDVLVNNTVVATNVSMGTSLSTLTVTGINITGSFTLTVTNYGGNVARFDNLNWTGLLAAGDYVSGFSNRAVSGTSQSVTGLSPETTYYLRVRATNAAGVSAYSPTAEATTFAENQLTQTITFPAIGNKLTTDAVGLAATASSGLPVSFSVLSGPGSISGGTNLSFSGAGTVLVVASQAGDSLYYAAPEVTNSITVSKTPAAVTLRNLTQLVDGGGKTPTVVTEPAGLSVTLTYDGGSNPPSAVGTYSVVATIDDAIYQGSASGNMVLASGNLNWDGDNSIGNFSFWDNWYGNTFPAWGFNQGYLVFNFKNGGQSSLYYDLSWSSINGIVWETTFPTGLELNGGGNGIDFNDKVENRSSYTQTINIPLSGGKNGAPHIELNPVNGDLVLNSPVYNDNNKPFKVFGDNAKLLTINVGLTGNTNVSFAIEENSKVKIASAQSWGDASNGVEVKAGELWMDPAGSLSEGVPVTLGRFDDGTAKIYLASPAGGQVFAHAITVVNSNGAGNKTIGSLNTSGTNRYSGTISLNGVVNLEAATGGTLEFSGVIEGGVTQIVVNGYGQTVEGRVVLLGDNTFSGTTLVQSGDLVVDGSLSNATVEVADGAVATGEGNLGTVAIGGDFSPGKESGAPATVTVGALLVQPGATFMLDMTNAFGEAGRDWDLIEADTIQLPASGTVTIKLMGTPAGFNPTESNSWRIMNGTVSGFNPDRFAVDTSAFEAEVSGGTFSITEGSLNLEYTPSPTAVVLYHLRAVVEGEQVVVRWQTASEENTVGFWLEREETGAWVRVNGSLVYAEGIDGGGASYALTDAGAAAGGTYRYRLVELEADGESRVYGPFERTATSLQIKPPVTLVDDRVEIRWLSREGEVYELLRATNLTSGFETLQSGIPATPPENTAIDDPPAGPLYYRIRINE